MTEKTSLAPLPHPCRSYPTFGSLLPPPPCQRSYPTFGSLLPPPPPKRPYPTFGSLLPPLKPPLAPAPARGVLKTDRHGRWWPVYHDDPPDILSQCARGMHLRARRRQCRRLDPSRDRRRPRLVSGLRQLPLRLLQRTPPPPPAPSPWQAQKRRRGEEEKRVERKLDVRRPSVTYFRR